jgi:PEP-CTERM motif
MNARHLLLWTVAAAAVAVAVGPSGASAKVANIPAFDSTNGTAKGTDIWSNKWTYSLVSSTSLSYTEKLTYSGVFKGTYDGVTYDAENFTIALNLPGATSSTFKWISETSTLPGWTETTFGPQVTFNAPLGVVLKPGDLFGFSVTYVSTGIAKTKFRPAILPVKFAGTTANWDAKPAAPEASTWAMMGLGFAGLAFAGYRKARKTPVAA